MKIPSLPAWLAALLFLFPSLSPAAPANVFDAPVLHPAIPMLDEDGRHVLDTGKPYSTRMTCGNGNGSGCHDYDAMNHAYHFEQGRDEADDLFGTRRWVNYLVSPGYFGGYNCVQGSATGELAKKVNADTANFGEWGAAGFLKACSSCHMGGGWEEKDRDGIRYDQRAADTIPWGDGDYYERSGSTLALFDWKASGVREADCLTCHADFSSLEKKGLPAQFAAASAGDAYAHWGFLQDQKFVRSNFFRYANSAMLEFLNLKPGNAAFPNGLNLLSVARKNFRAGTTYKPDYDLDLDATTGQPKLTWNKDAFDANGKVQIPMLRFPHNDNCMMCHLASAGINRISSGKANGSRRGFHGFGDEALVTTGAGGVVIPDYKDDVHKGKSWTNDNGETRVIDNCNACHTREYYKPLSANVALDANHNFPKSKGDSDIRRDLDNDPGPLACRHCHDDGVKHPALPSGQKNALDAHRELWKASGDMAGYTADSLNKIVQTHLDTVACETCHITNIKANDTTPIQIRYRWRPDENGQPKIIPYKPQSRYYAQDKNSGRILYRYEANPSAALNTYDDWKNLKASYDQKLKDKGYANPDVQFVETETSEYNLAHQTKTSPESVQCEECHAKKQSGAFSSLVSEAGLLGSGNVATVMQLPTRKLVDEGIVKLGQPYYKVDDSGKITENAADVLEYTRNHPNMSVLNAADARDASGEWKRVAAAKGLDLAAVGSAEERHKLAGELGSADLFVFDVRSAAPELQAFSMLAESTVLSDALLPRYRLDVEMTDIPADQKQSIAAGLSAKPVSGAYSVKVTDHQNRKPLTSFQGAKVLVKLPYRGAQSAAQKVKVLSGENGTWTDTGIQPVLLHSADAGAGTNLPGGANLEDPTPDGYVVFTVTQPFAVLALADELPKSCALPWGGNLASGAAVQAWRSAESSDCAGGVETRSCTDGALSGSFRYPACKAADSTAAPTPTPTPTPTPAPLAEPAPAVPGTSPTPATPVAIAAPADWASVQPTGDCSSGKCRKALTKAKAKLKVQARSALKAQAEAEAAAAKAARGGLSAQAQSRLQAAATRKAAAAARALAAYQATAAALRGLSG